MKIEDIFSHIDKITTGIVESEKIGYSKALYQASRIILEQELPKDYEESLEDLILNELRVFNEGEFDAEKIREAVFLLILKSLKEDNRLVSDHTPSVFAVLAAYVLKLLSKGKKHLSIIDPVCGISNMLNCVLNYLETDDVDAFGFDISEEKIFYGQIMADLVGNKIDFILEDFIESNIVGFDFAVLDAPRYLYDDEYFPPLLINKLAHSLNDDAYLVALIPEDFYEYSKDYQEEFLNLYDIVGMIEIDDSYFASKKNKLVLSIFKKKGEIKITDILIAKLGPIDKKASLLNIVKVINEHFDK